MKYRVIGDREVVAEYMCIISHPVTSHQISVTEGRVWKHEYCTVYSVCTYVGTTGLGASLH